MGEQTELCSYRGPEPAHLLACVPAVHVAWKMTVMLDQGKGALLAQGS